MKRTILAVFALLLPCAPIAAQTFDPALPPNELALAKHLLAREDSIITWFEKVFDKDLSKVARPEIIFLGDSAFQNKSADYAKYLPFKISPNGDTTKIRPGALYNKLENRDYFGIHTCLTEV